MDSIRHNVNCLTKKVLEQPKPDAKRAPSLLPPNVSLLIVSKIVPRKKSIRLSLPHCVDDPSVCLIVKDTDKRDYNRSVEAWKLRWKTDKSKAPELRSRVPNPTFLPLRELKLAYQTFSSKRRLAATFDTFLADRRIIHHLPTKLGKPFYGEARGKIPVPVDLATGNVVRKVCAEINTIIFAIRGAGTSESVPVGTMQLKLDQLKENVLSVCEIICTEWPDGGLDNIRSIYIQVPRANIPIYFDSSEPSLDLVAPVPIESVVSSMKANTVRSLTKDLINKVAEDLPLPHGGLSELFAIAQPKKIQPKRVGATKKMRSSKTKR
ncbi:Ribosomal L1 domain-containing protein 1 [Fasciola hepatica]|uniref:Ribosomal L1 domain-containing protein 1 n=1 Tax=Fasciola hepatica TaxID=6192 RepID=A0A2H1BRX2_FASHE|nr:Ribosomal L1 domain-containing protein 1 [Fasciola hepatica]